TPEAKKPDAASVAGTWNVTLMSHQVALVLEQDGTKVTGTMMMMGTEVKVDGTFADGVLKLTSNARMMGRPPAETREEGHAPPPGSAKEGTALTLTAKLQEDGTLAGEAPGPNGPVAWTGERLKVRKPKAAAAAGPGLTGAWKMSATSPQGAMAFDLTLAQDGEKITGTINSAHSGELKLEGGTFASGTLTFSTGGTGPNTMHLDYRATVKDDGT